MIHLNDPSTKKREKASLLQAMAELNLRDGTIVTMDEEDIIQMEDKKIAVVPAWKYLLQF